ncbi:SIR2 family NAD-dependent protein deacylase [Methanobacterium paludis]|uniref:Deacetylase sirtuin-type domain-containing protein n=1 Tax=Methanobacterium paludis (strain DSM 25820 / JCM 18151 / SWAN1) TaxID=868131 RepID=F6D537_METPW|nr:SIR2 family protein [Methanobacterium paludis]AEG17572.1 hypothetical protein MSWAN_0534 [Methanobacterium paludis]
MVYISEKQKKIIEDLENEMGNLMDVYDFLIKKNDNEPIITELLKFWDSTSRPSGNIQHRSVNNLSIRLAHEEQLQMDTIIKSSPLMDKELLNIKLNENDNITFLLGAGASAPSNIPTVNKLLPELWKGAEKIGRDDLDKLTDYCRSSKINNIEDLLTAAYISEFATKNHDINNLLEYFLFPEKKQCYDTKKVNISKMDASSISFLQDTLQILFGLLTSTMISASPNAAHESIANFVQNHENTSIITTNYDGCMDEALLNKEIEFEGTKTDTGKLKLLKMHGSINWSYCESCQEVLDFDLLEVKEIYDKDIMSFPIMGICQNCGGLRRPLLVPPMAFKFLNFPNLIDIWNSAQQTIMDSNYIIVVGYSFSESDTYISKIIARSMSENPNQTLVVIDTDKNLVKKLRKKYSARIKSFDDERILQSSDKCDIILPKLLQSMLNGDPKGSLIG